MFRRPSRSPLTDTLVPYTTLCRAVAACREQVEHRGGVVVAELAVAAEPVDMGTALATAAAGEGGVDAVFMAGRPRQAAALVPQFATAGLDRKSTRLNSSH